MSRVVITDAGVVSAIGSGLDRFFGALDSAKPGISTIKSFDTAYFPTKLGAEVKDFDYRFADHKKDKKELFVNKTLDDMIAGNDVLKRYRNTDRILNIGFGLDSLNVVDYLNSSDKDDHNWMEYMSNSYRSAQDIAEKYDIKGGYNVDVSACVASTNAIGLSFRMLKENADKVIVTGGSDSMLNHLHYMGFYKLGALSQWEDAPEESCRPFDKKRCGLVLGEGAAMFILQSMEKAEPDDIMVEISGYGSTMDAYKASDPAPDGKILAKAAFKAMQEAGLTPDDIDCVHLHGTGTPKNAIAEANTMRIIFKERYRELPVFSLKGQVGHLIGACGAIELLAVIYSIKRQMVPVTVNYEEADEEVGLNVITGRPLSMKIDNVLKLSAAFGGQNTAFVIKRFCE